MLKEYVKPYNFQKNAQRVPNPFIQKKVFETMTNFLNKEYIYIYHI